MDVTLLAPTGYASPVRAGSSGKSTGQHSATQHHGRHPQGPVPSAPQAPGDLLRVGFFFHAGSRGMAQTRNVATMPVVTTSRRVGHAAAKVLNSRTLISCAGKPVGKLGAVEAASTAGNGTLGSITPACTAGARRSRRALSTVGRSYTSVCASGRRQHGIAVGGDLRRRKVRRNRRTMTELSATA